ncbi:hypothetical protein D0Z00_003842 [Geotrichum galactomycetum]|uniref:Uncharacterized protein n=1 Tax=Geotrichum galactomycetum TaxID=27317 RepID=A0ACB6V056_9ASCO|nr:hypothetical protein D0Z00_003842 [Geotrichum candidum]
MSSSNSIDHSQAALEAASRYAHDKCLHLVHSAATIIVDPPSCGSSDEQPSPSSIYSSAKLSSSATSPMYTTSMHDDASSSLLTDEPGDFGIDRQIVQAALAALGSDNRLILAGKVQSSNSSTNSGHRRPKKKLSEMDEDERLLASSEAKKLTARQRRQIRNRVSARQFRLRRKEYISQLEMLVVNMTTKINGLEKALAESRTENKLLNETKPNLVQQQPGQVKLQQQQQQMPHQPMFVLPEYSQNDTNIAGFSDLFTQGSLSDNLAMYSQQELNLAVSPSSSINSPWSNSMSEISSTSATRSLNTNNSTNKIAATNAETIRMSPNIVNLLPPYHDQLLDWPEQHILPDSGYIQIPTTGIYHSKVPDAKDQLLAGQKKSEDSQKPESKPSPADKTPKEKKDKTPAEDKLSSLVVDTLFSKLDMKMSSLKI